MEGTWGIFKQQRFERKKTSVKSLPAPGMRDMASTTPVAHVRLLAGRAQISVLLAASSVPLCIVNSMGTPLPEMLSPHPANS